MSTPQHCRTRGHRRQLGPRRPMTTLWCAAALCTVAAAACSDAPGSRATDAAASTADSTEGEPAIEAPEPPDPGGSAQFSLVVDERPGETPAYETPAYETDPTVTIRGWCRPVHEVRSRLTMDRYDGDPVEGLAFELVASDGTVLDSSPVWFFPDMPDPLPEGGLDHGSLYAVVAHRSDWPAMRFRDGSAVIYETADPPVQDTKCYPDHPRVEFILPPPGQTVRQGESVEVSWTVSGLYGDDLRYKLFLLDESGSTELGELSESSYQFDIGAHEKIAFEVKARVQTDDGRRWIYGQSAVVRVEER